MTSLISRIKSYNITMVIVAYGFSTLIGVGFLANYSIAQETMSEGQAEAALLYNFIKNTQWPAEDELSKFSIRFVGDNRSFRRQFEKIAANETVRGKSLEVSNSLDFDYSEGSRQQVLVLAGDFNEELESIASQLTGTATLLITENALSKDRKSVMYNLLLETDSIAFEVNRSNVIYEKLTISNDVMLYGGTEIEIATLYKEMDQSLLAIKAKVEKQRSDLQLSTAELTESLRDMGNVKAELIKQQLLIANKNEEIIEKNGDLQKQKNQLELIKVLLTKNQLGLKNGERLLRAKEENIASLEAQISDKQTVLISKLAQIQQLESSIDEKLIRMEMQEGTILSQRFVIVLAGVFLFIFMVFIVYRQRQALIRERKLYEAENAVVKAQSESLKAYESSLKLKNDFLAAINHELRTPLNGLVGAIQLADNNNLASMQDTMEIISKCSENMYALVGDILIYTEIQSEQLELQLEPTDIVELFDGLKGSYQKNCDEKKLVLNWDVNVGDIRLVELDSEKFVIVLNKIIDNAIKFTKLGSVDLTVRSESLGDCCQLHCTIRDTGVGFTEEVREHLFELFWQDDTGLDRGYEGLGMGLAISKKLIRYMGGDIEINQNEENGIVVSISIKVPIVDNPGDMVSQKKELGKDVVKQIEALELPEILIVEDNKVNQMILQRMLQQQGFSSVVVEDGEKALKELEQLSPSLIFMDLQMPNMDGITCTKHIREFSQVGIIAVSANLSGSQQRKCIEAGMNDVLPKPITVALLEKILQTYLPKTIV